MKVYSQPFYCGYIVSFIKKLYRKIFCVFASIYIYKDITKKTNCTAKWYNFYNSPESWTIWFYDVYAIDLDLNSTVIMNQMDYPMDLYAS